MLGQFLTGLKEEIRAEVRVLNPINLEQAMELALRVEERNKVNSGKKFGSGSYKMGQYSSVSFRSSSPGRSTNYSQQSSPSAIRSWAS